MDFIELILETTKGILIGVIAAGLALAVIMSVWALLNWLFSPSQDKTEVRKERLESIAASKGLENRHPVFFMDSEDRLLNEVTGLLWRLTSWESRQQPAGLFIEKSLFQALASLERAPQLLAILRTAGFIPAENANAFEVDVARLVNLHAEIGKRDADSPIRRRLIAAIKQHNPGTNKETDL